MSQKGQVLSRHARSHLPGGSDPLASTLTPWAALYDDYVMGQWIGDGAVEGNNVEIWWPFGAISDNADNYFELVLYDNTEYDWTDAVRLKILKSGVYTITLNVNWSDPDKPKTLVNYYFDAKTSQSRFNFPGELGSPWYGLWNYVLHDTEDFNSWDTRDTVSWTYPLYVSTPDVIDMRAIIVDWAVPTTGTFSGLMGERRLWVVRHGDLDYANWPFP